MPTTSTTIAQTFDQFLADQKARLKPTTFAKYYNIVDLFHSYLESYWPGHGQDEYSRITGEGGTFCDTFGPEEILGGYSEFLGYFMPNKVMCGKDTMQAAGTVTKKLAKWLAEKGYDRLYGARPMGRVIQDKVKTPLANELLFGALQGGGKVVVDAPDGSEGELTLAFPESS